MESLTRARRRSSSSKSSERESRRRLARRACKRPDLFQTYKVVAIRATNKNARTITVRLGPDLRTGTVAGWRVVNAGVSC